MHQNETSDTDAANPTGGEARNALISMILNETLGPF
jgi:hypothetical protein